MILQVNINENLLNYVRQSSIRENSTLCNLREFTSQMQERNMQISPEQGQFIYLLLKMLQAKKTMEIGVFTGYSTLWTALALPDYGEVIACDLNEEWLSVAKEYWTAGGCMHKIKPKCGQACQIMEEIINQPNEKNSFDFIFIDADKVNYDIYYENALKLIRPGGLIMLDNTLWSGQVAESKYEDPETKALRAINAKLLADERVDISMLPYCDGVSLVVKR